MHLCIGFAFLFFSTGSPAQSCITDTKLLQYNSDAFQNTGTLSFPLSLSLADNGTAYFMNKQTAAGDSLSVFKIASDGTVAWSKAWNQTGTDYSCRFIQCTEMNNGNLLLSGSVSYLPGHSGPAMICLLMTNAQGNLLWQKTYTGLGWNGGYCTPGKNGEIVLFALSTNNYQIQITILDGGGNVLRTAAYLDPAFTMVISPGNVRMLNGKIYLMNTYADYNSSRGFSTGFYSLVFDYAALQLIDNKVYSLHHDAPACDSLLLLGASFATTANGRLVFSANISFNNCPKASRYFVQLDPDLHIIDDQVQVFSCERGGRVFLTNDYMAVDKATGNMMYGMTYNTNGSTAYYAVIDPGYTPVLQRKIITNDVSAYPVISLPGFDISNPVTGLFANGAYYQLNSLSADNTIGQSCVGEDTAFLVPSRLIATPINIPWAKNGTMPPASTDLLPASGGFTINTTVLCQQKSTCDSIKIKGDSSFCLDDSSASFILFKNAQCYKKSIWGIDTTAFSHIEQVNDTIVRVHFVKGWKGYIRATLAGCGLKDSLFINIRAPLQDPGIGGDTVLCPGASISLHAGSHFKTYAWQDGSTDSLYTVRDTGSYQVTVTDSCNNIYSGVWTVKNARFKLDLGPDLEMCSKDSAVITLPEGFSGYTWYPAYASLTNNMLSFYPGVTTSFYITAQKQPGCEVADTITVVVTDCRDKLYFPSAFTPNSDGHNDFFKPHADGRLLFFEMAIFNRWGQQLFKTTDVLRGWNGLFNGVKQPPGAYIWYCKYRFGATPATTMRGSFILLP